MRDMLCSDFIALDTINASSARIVAIENNSFEGCAGMFCVGECGVEVGNSIHVVLLIETDKGSS